MKKMIEKFLYNNINDLIFEFGQESKVIKCKEIVEKYYTIKKPNLLSQKIRNEKHLFWLDDVLNKYSEYNNDNNLYLFEFLYGYTKHSCFMPNKPFECYLVICENFYKNAFGHFNDINVFLTRLKELCLNEDFYTISRIYKDYFGKDDLCQLLRTFNYYTFSFHSCFEMKYSKLKNKFKDYWIDYLVLSLLYQIVKGNFDLSNSANLYYKSIYNEWIQIINSTCNREDHFISVIGTLFIQLMNNSSMDFPNGYESLAKTIRLLFINQIGKEDFLLNKNFINKLIDIIKDFYNKIFDN